MKANCVVCGNKYDGARGVLTCGLACSNERRAWRIKAYNASPARKAARLKYEQKIREQRKRFHDTNLRACVICDAPFQARHKRHKTCSSSCGRIHALRRDRLKRHGTTDYAKARCVICGEEFRKDRAKKTCGTGCSKELHRRSYRKCVNANRSKYREIYRKYWVTHLDKVRERNRIKMMRRTKANATAELLGVTPQEFAVLDFLAQPQSWETTR